jgi:hypothetical protein
MSLESDSNTRVLFVAWDGTIPKQRYRQAVAVWSGSENISEAEQGNTGTRESLPSPHVEDVARGQPRDQIDRVTQGICCSCSNDKNKQQALSGICTEGDRRKRDGRRQS